MTQLSTVFLRISLWYFLWLLQIIGHKDALTQEYTHSEISKLDILTGSYARMFNIYANSTEPRVIQINGCGVNPLDTTIYCFARLADESYDLIRADRKQVGVVRAYA